MPRRARAQEVLRWVMLATCCAAWFCSSSSSQTSASLAFSAASAQSLLADVALILGALIAYVVRVALPGTALAFVCYLVYSRRTLTPKAWGMVAFALVGSSILWALLVRAAAVAAPVNDTASASSGQPDQHAQLAMSVHSGELSVRAGQFVVLPDPRMADPSRLEEGWQSALATSMTEAISSGREQVVLVFSRQNCPWCERQKPVLERAIQQRARAIISASGMGTPQTAFLGGVGAKGGLLLAPLRIFVLDADDFPSLVQQFGVQAFPTLLVFGPPGAAPLMAPGYLDEASLGSALHRAATSRPRSAGAGGRSGGAKAIMVVGQMIAPAVLVISFVMFLLRHH